MKNESTLSAEKSAPEQEAPLTDELLSIARDIEALKRPCGMDPESATAIQNGRYMSIAYRLRALASAPRPLTEPEALETIAMKVYEAMDFDQPNWVPWVRGGNSDVQEHARRVARSIAALAPRPLVSEPPAGWKLVPLDPTVPMLTALWNRKDCDSPAELEAAYAAMLVAAPANLSPAQSIPDRPGESEGDPASLPLVSSSSPTPSGLA